MSRQAWTREQLDFLCAHYGHMTVDQLREDMPGTTRSATSIYRKAGYLGLTDASGRAAWKRDERMREDLYDLAVLDLTADQIAREINAQYGTNFCGEWARKTLSQALPHQVYSSWRQRANARRSRALSEYARTKNKPRHWIAGVAA